MHRSRITPSGVLRSGSWAGLGDSCRIADRRFPDMSQIGFSLHGGRTIGRVSCGVMSPRFQYESRLSARIDLSLRMVPCFSTTRAIALRNGSRELPRGLGGSEQPYAAQRPGPLRVPEK